MINEQMEHITVISTAGRNPQQQGTVISTAGRNNPQFLVKK